MSGALYGLRVLDFSTLLPGPMATLFMADAGADVIKVERPGDGDDMRGYDPKWGADSANFHMLNRGKRSIALDLKSPADIARLRPLLETADILVEQFRPGVMARLGLSYRDIRVYNPRIIYCSISGYGQTGPMASLAGHDLNYQGETGLLALSLGSPEFPVIPPALLADIAGGTYPALVNVLLALLQRERTGTGTHIDIAMAEGLFPFTYWALGEGVLTGRWPDNGDALVTGGTPRYRLYPTSDGRFVAVAAIEQKFWNILCETIELDAALRDDSRDPDATIAGVGALIGSQTAAHWDGILAAADCCCSVVKSLAEALKNPQFEVRGVFDRRLAGPEDAEIMALPVPIVEGLRKAGNGAEAAPLRDAGGNDAALPHWQRTEP